LVVGFNYTKRGRGSRREVELALALDVCDLRGMRSEFRREAREYIVKRVRRLRAEKRGALKVAFGYSVKLLAPACKARKSKATLHDTRVRMKRPNTCLGFGHDAA
jgi:hypothetical protein